MTKSEIPSLIDAKGLGGLIAQDGFDYQVWDALARLPAWLRNPSFEGFALEMLEDAEARFFAPNTPHRHLIERFQAKSGMLDRAGLIEVFEAFRAFEAAHPQVARVHVLVTPALPPRLAWLARDTDRVRRARPFYEPFAGIRAADDDKLRTDLVAEFDPELGEFFFNNIEVSLRPVCDRSVAEAAFSSALLQQFPDLDVSTRKLSAAFSRLSDLAGRMRGSLLSRSMLLDVLRETLEVDVVPHRHALPVHVRSDRNGEIADALEIDASKFSGGPAGFPESDGWRTGLLDPLNAVATWARKHELRRIALSGSYRLSTAFALGWSFRSAIGFEIDIPTKSGAWLTDTHPAADTPLVPWEISEPQALVGDHLMVGIGVLRDPGPDILASWGLVDKDLLLLATLPQALAEGAQVQTSVALVKAAIVKAVGRLRPTQVDLCYVGPAAFAVALGHRWNALPRTQMHEFDAAERAYRPTVLLG